MQLRRLRLIDFRGVREADVAFRAPGVTVVLADNECGKSSLLEALEKLFRLPDDSRHRDLRSVQPVGRDVGTTVEGELLIGGHEVVYRKTWFRGRGTELSVDGRGYSGREAHDRAADLFARHVDQQLWESLVVGQAASLVQPVPRDVEVLQGVLRRQADESGEQAEGPDEGGALAEAVEREYRKYFTARDGRPTADLATVIADRDAAAAQLSDAHERLQRIQLVIADAERLHQERRLVADQQAGHQHQLEQLREQLDAARLAESGLAKADSLAQLARVRADTAQATALARAQLITAHTEATEAVTQAEQALAAAQAQVERAERTVESVREQVAERSAELRASRDRLTRRARARRHQQDLDDLNRLQTRIDAIAAARADEVAARAAVDRAGEVTAEDVEHVDKLARDLALGRATVAATAPTLTVHRLGKPSVQVDGPVTTAVQADAELGVPITDVTAVRVPGVLDLTVRPGADAAGARASVEQVQRDLDDALDALDVPDIAALRSLVHDREEAARAAADAVRLAQVHLAGETYDDLVRARDEITARLQPNGADDDAAGNDAAGNDPADNDAVANDAVANDAVDNDAADGAVGRTAGSASGRLEDGEEELAEDALEAAVRDAEAAHDAARTSMEHAQELAGQRRSELVKARVLADAAGAQLAQLAEQLEAGRAELSDEDVLRATDAAAQEADAADAAAQQARQEFVDAGLDTVATRHAEAVEVAEQLTSQLAQIDAGRHAAQARLDDAGAAGLATEVDVAEARAAQADERYRLVNERAAAARLLRDTLTEHRVEARRAYAAPLKELIEQLGRVAFGPSFGVTLDDLEVTERRLDGLVLPVESLSTGAREQLAIVVRLAISRLTAPEDGGVPLILDDALGWADPRRLAQMHRLLGEAGRTGQVVLLTSQRARYNLVPGAGEPVRLQAAGVATR